MTGQLGMIFTVCVLFTCDILKILSIKYVNFQGKFEKYRLELVCSELKS